MAVLTYSDIQSEVESAGFILLGIHPPVPPKRFPAFSNWIDKGLYAGMDWIAKPHSLRLRANPASLLPGSRSLISLGVLYPAPGEEAPKPGFGRVAGYARIADYHRVLPPQLRSLGRRIAQMAGKDAKMKVFVDSSPLLERSLASASGHCWIGKNTCLISPEWGSFLFLAEILLDIDLPYSQQKETDHCGTCRRCIDACPTGCIRPDRLIDAGRCISYLTIEHKGIIPAELRPLVGDWIFGCDVCQIVCPWNQKQTAHAGSSIFSSPPGPVYLNLADEMQMNVDDFDQHYSGLPIHRGGWENHLRNAITCAGNSGDGSLIPRLGEILMQSPAPTLRVHAAWALGRMLTPTARYVLESALKNEENPQTQNEIKTAIESIK
jgi:epoxyqueuosine reductase